MRPLYCLPFQFIYRRVELGQTIWDKTEVLLGTSWKLEEPHGNTLGTKGGEMKASHPTLLSPKEKNRPPHECMLSLLIGCMKKL